MTKSTIIIKTFLVGVFNTVLIGHHRVISRRLVIETLSIVTPYIRQEITDNMSFLPDIV